MLNIQVFIYIVFLNCFKMKLPNFVNAIKQFKQNLAQKCLVKGTAEVDGITFNNASEKNITILVCVKCQPHKIQNQLENRPLGISVKVYLNYSNQVYNTCSLWVAPFSRQENPDCIRVFKGVDCCGERKLMSQTAKQKWRC